MAQHATDPAGWRQLLTAIPPHWATVLAPIAEGIAAEWAQFADQLKNQATWAPSSPPTPG